MLKILLTTLALGAALFAAQPHQQMPTQQTQSVDLKSLNQNEVKGFANALAQIDELRQKLQSEMPTQQEQVDQAKMQEINQKFQTKATAIIEKQGLTIQSYEKYVQLFQTNPEFQQQVQGLLTKK